MKTWRVGAQIPLNVYEGDRPVCQCHTAEDARRIVAAMNAMPVSGREGQACECAARGVPMEIVRSMQKRADEYSALCGERPLYELPVNERYYRNAGASTAIYNLANEIGSEFVNRIESAPCPCEGLRAEEPSPDAWKELIRWAYWDNRDGAGRAPVRSPPTITTCAKSATPSAPNSPPRLRATGV